MGGTRDENEIAQLSKELRGIGRFDWQTPATFKFYDMPETTELMADGNDDLPPAQRVEELRQMLIALIARLREEEAQQTQPVPRSDADAGEALLELSDSWLAEHKTLTQRREWVCGNWTRRDGDGTLASPKSFARSEEPALYLRLANALVEMVEGPSPQPPKDESNKSKRRAIGRAPTWPVEPHPAQDQELVLLLASPRMRNGPGSELVRLVREFEPYWRISRPMIYAVDGAYREIRRSGVLDDYANRQGSPSTDFVRLPAGVEGGLVHATELVVAAGELKHKRACVIYLLDSRDPASLYPETAALKRECLLSQTPYLNSYRGALRWLALEWACVAAKERRRPEDQALILDRNRALQIKGVTDDPDAMIALAAHDRHKLGMLEFVEEYADMLTEDFDSRYATEATGILLNGGTIDDIDREFGYYEIQGRTREGLATAIDQHQQQRAQSNPEAWEAGGNEWAELLTHGRRGGVVQLARKVLDGDCSSVAFFQDPETPREHDMDIEVLDRAAQMTTSDCLLLYDNRSARRWAGNRARCRAGGQLSSPVTLVEAYRHHYGVELVLAHPPFEETAKRRRTRRSPSADPWKRVAETAAIHVLGSILTAVQHRRAQYQPARVGFAWGGVMQDIVGGPGVEDSLLAQALQRRQDVGGNSAGAHEAIRELDLRVLPTVGLVGSKVPGVEAQTIVARAAKILGGRALTHPEFAFQFGDSRDDPLQARAIRDEWRELDVLVCNCDKVRKDPGKRLVGLPAGLYEEVKQAAGVFGTIYLEAKGKSVIEAGYGSFRQTGIPFDEVQRLVERPNAEVILVAGALETRQRPAWAAITAGLVSTLITDPQFAWELLSKDLDGTWERYRDEPD